MQQDITGQVLGVTGKPTSNGGTKFDVAFSDGNSYSTFDGGLATKASGLTGQAVSARIEQKPSRDGQRMFLNLVDIAPQGQLAAGAVPLPGTPVTVGTTVPPVSNGAQNIPIVQPETQAQKDARIARTSAVKYGQELVAALFQGAGPESLDQALECIDKAGERFYNLLTGDPQVSAAPEVVPAEATPQAVAAAVNEAAGTQVVVPWGAAQS